MKYLLAFCLLLAALPAKGSSQQPVELDVNFLDEKSETLPECDSTHNCRARAGNPHKVAFWARPAKEHKYAGYYVGGGVTPARFSHGEYRFAHEGTWGKDYAPWYSRVQLLWSHGRFFQGGTGSYEPDHQNVPLGQRYGRRIRRGH